MNERYVIPFLSSVEAVLEQFGIMGITRGAYDVKDDMVIDQEVTAFVGIVGALRGNISYSFTVDTAKNIASTMMMGMSVPELDEMARSAIAELSNMILGTAASAIANDKILIDITPPSVIVGEQMYFILSSTRTTTIKMDTPLGPIEVNIGLEI